MAINDDRRMVHNLQWKNLFFVCLWNLEMLIWEVEHKKKEDDDKILFLTIFLSFYIKMVNWLSSDFLHEILVSNVSMTISVIYAAKEIFLLSLRHSNRESAHEMS